MSSTLAVWPLNIFSVLNVVDVVINSIPECVPKIAYSSERKLAEMGSVVKNLSGRDVTRLYLKYGGSSLDMVMSSHQQLNSAST